MKIHYSKALGASFALTLLGLSVSAQTGIGIGTTAPRTMLDVNGAISVAEGSVIVSGNAATIPTGFSFVKVTGTATATVTLTASSTPAFVPGQLLTIFNTTSFNATFGGQTIAAGQALNLVFSNTTWQATANGGNIPTTASNGLSKTGSSVGLGGTLAGATDVATGGFNLTFSGTGKIGIGMTTPNAPLQFSNTLVNRKIVLWEGTNNDNQFFGFGISNNTLRYQVNALTDSHVFFAGTGASMSNELMRISGNGNVGIGTATPGAMLEVAGSVKLTTLSGTGSRAVVAASDGTLSTSTASSSYFASGTTGSFDPGGATGAGAQTQTNAVNSAASILNNGNGSSSVVITFTTPASSANYDISFSLFGTATNSIAYPTVTNKTTTGFAINFWETNGIQQSVSFDYTVRLR